MSYQNASSFAVLRGFEAFEDFSGAPDDAQGHAGHLCYMDAIAAPERTRRHAMQENDLALFIFADGHRIHAQVRQFLRHRCQFVVVSGEERPGCCEVMQVLDNSPRNRQAIVSARAPADLIQDNQAMPRGMMQDSGSFLHLHHERAFTGRNVILSADAGKNAVHQPDARTAGRHKAANLR